jgi:phosphohistidine phosphatase
MPTLALFRHAKAAVPLQDQRDFDRPLTEGGRDDAARMGNILAEFGIDLAILSAAKRTVETWEIAAGSLRPTPPASIERSLYLCRPNQLIERIQAIPDSSRNVVVIGHNPCWHEVALWLAGNSGSGSLRNKFPTAALAVFSVATSWAKLEPDHAKLERFVAPGALR